MDRACRQRGSRKVVCGHDESDNANSNRSAAGLSAGAPESGSRIERAANRTTDQKSRVQIMHRPYIILKFGQTIAAAHDNGAGATIGSKESRTGRILRSHAI